MDSNGQEQRPNRSRVHVFQTMEARSLIYVWILIWLDKNLSRRHDVINW